VTDDVAVRLRGEKELASAAEADAVVALLCRPGVQAGVLDALPEAVEADQRLRPERWRRLDRGHRPVEVHREEQQLQARRKLVLTALARDLDAEREAATPHHALDDRLARFELIRT
jgi:hypothetical protein